MAIISGPQNLGLPGYKLPPKPKLGTPAVNDVGGVKAAAAARSAPKPNGFGNLGIEGSGFATRNDAVVTPDAAPAAAAVVAPPIDWEKQIADDPEGALQQTYLNRQNTITTDALRKAWLQHTQGSQDSYNSHGALFSGAFANAQLNAGDDYKNQLKQQELNYDKGGHDIHTSVLHRLMLQLTGVDDLMGK